MCVTLFAVFPRVVLCFMPHATVFFMVALFRFAGVFLRALIDVLRWS